MKSNPLIRRRPGKRILRAAAFGSTAAIGSVTIAGGASAAVLSLAVLGSALGLNGSIFQWLQPIIAAASISTIGSSKPVTPPPSSTTVEKPATKPEEPVAGGAGGKRAMKLGVNIETPNYYNNIRAFSNLLVLNEWKVTTDRVSTPLKPEWLDQNQNLVRLEANQVAQRIINPPTRALDGGAVDVICRWTGSAKISVSGPPVKNPRVGANSLTFTFAPKTKAHGEERALFVMSQMDKANPVRNLDCREPDADPNAVYDPTFVAAIAQYDTIRFMKWQAAVEKNLPVTWATRTKATFDSYPSNKDGIPVERMVLLANEAKANPWFTMPWNADADYIRKFAEYVRDNLDPRLVAYVETSNEVWNWGYKVTAQARDEGRARNLAGDDGKALLYRYAERTGEVMDIWKDVFARTPKRLVRVLATQNANPWAAKTVLNYKDTASKVDALATAPYFGSKLAAGATPPADFFSAVLAEQIDKRLANAVENKAYAQEKGLRYITYEAGQHVTIGGGEADLPMLASIQRDRRMGDLYTRYLTKWKDEFGDLMVLYSFAGPISRHGAWGMQEYLGQPLSEAPKAQAVDKFRRSYVTKN